MSESNKKIDVKYILDVKAEMEAAKKPSKVREYLRDDQVQSRFYNATCTEFVAEAAENLKAVRKADAAIDDDSYRKAMENIERLTKSAKAVSDIEESRSKRKSAAVGAISGLVTTGVMIGVDCVFKHPISGTVRKIFRM